MPFDKDEENEKRQLQVEQNLRYIRALGYRVIHKRECDWRTQKTLSNLYSVCKAMHDRFFPDTRLVIAVCMLNLESSSFVCQFFCEKLFFL